VLDPLRRHPVELLSPLTVPTAMERLQSDLRAPSWERGRRRKSRYAIRGWVSPHGRVTMLASLASEEGSGLVAWRILEAVLIEERAGCRLSGEIRIRGAGVAALGLFPLAAGAGLAVGTAVVVFVDAPVLAVVFPAVAMVVAVANLVRAVRVAPVEDRVMVRFLRRSLRTGAPAPPPGGP
jgi:hypothetical protein